MNTETSEALEALAGVVRSECGAVRALATRIVVGDLEAVERLDSACQRLARIAALAREVNALCNTAALVKRLQRNSRLIQGARDRATRQRGKK